MVKILKERLIGAVGGVSGFTSILGSWQVCHNICLGLIAVLGVLGVTVVGMPLLFLTKIAIPLWSVAFVLLIVVTILYFKKKCISKNLLILNSGLIIAGVPFKFLEKFLVFFWIIGGILVLISVYLFIKDKIRRKNEN